MPTYDYECDACGHAFELFQSMSAPVKRKCPDCGKPKLQRLIGKGAAVLFKGSGFYETDYKRNGGTNGESPSADASDQPKSESNKKSGADSAKSDKKAG